MQLTAEQRAVVVGSLLGDGAMRCKANALLEINHSTAQREYVDWKYAMLAELVATPPRERGGNGGRTAYRFVTRSLPALTPYYWAFYSAGRKVVPEVELTPLALAVWIMDDGSRSYRAMYLNTQQFAREDQERLMTLLWREFRISTTLNRDKGYQRIRIRVESIPRVREVVGGLVLPALAYKIPA